MGPLVPQIIGSEFDLVIAFFIGMGFGFILEQGGFSSTRKLAGLFYGYDFTVLRVFFTAGVTAMIGSLLLAHFGLLDLGLIYVNPTYLYAAILGGSVMGVGFIFGGFCPGTGFCAAAIGKIDAMAFIVGILLGILIFMEGFPIWGGIYTADYLGDLKINNVLGISQTLFAFILTAIAISAFVFITIIENRVNKRKVTYTLSKTLKWTGLALIPFLLIGILSFTKSKTEAIKADVNKELTDKDYKYSLIPAERLGSELVENYYKINLIDIRSPEEYKKYHLPLAINIPIDSMINRQWKDIFNQKHKTNIFYADDIYKVKKATLIAKHIGSADYYGLKENTKQFRKLFFDLEPKTEFSSKEELGVYEFRYNTGAEIIKLDERLKKLSQPVEKKAVKAKGGCV